MADGPQSRNYCEAAPCVGNKMENRAPFPLARLRAEICPPCASMIERQIGSPMPMPVDFVVKKLSNKCCSASFEMPGPVSSTSIVTLRLSAVTAVVR